ncbi:MAG: hypothetical protein AAGA77_22165 [Bacteroidota bacterium]
MKTKLLSAIALFFLVINQGNTQKFNSLIGARVGIETVEFSSKISLDEHNYLEGTVGVVTPQPDYTIGAGAAYHRHIHLNENQTFQFYYGAGVKGVFGDESGIGVGPQLGLLALYKKINIGVDVLPTYFFNDVLEFQPLFGVHLRWVNY